MIFQRSSKVKPTPEYASLREDYGPNSIALHMTQVAPGNVEAMADAMGLVVEYDSHLPPDIAGKLAKDRHAPAGFRVVVNARDNPRRQRFTIAHEIAHYVMHRDLITDDLVDSALYRSALSDDFERMADRFAAQILLPADAVRAAYREEKALAKLAERFNVSDAALRIRLKELRLGA